MNKSSVPYPPKITILAPGKGYNPAYSKFTIRWNDSDRDSDASIAFYYDDDNAGNDGHLIVEGLSEDRDGEFLGYDRYLWDTSGLDEGDYYIYAVIDDGLYLPKVAYSNGPVTVMHPSVDEIKLQATDGLEQDYFGSAVDLCNGCLAVGMLGDDDPVSAVGSVVIFRQEDGSWVEECRLRPADPRDGMEFGAAVGLNGDTLVVGAPYHSGAGTWAGAAYVFRKVGPEWVEEARLVPADQEEEDFFGRSVDVYGDTAVIGSVGGKAYVFRRAGTVWEQEQQLREAGVSGPYPSFGEAVAVWGDRLVVGASNADGAAARSGAAYVFHRGESGWVEEARLTAADGDAYDDFGTAVDIYEDTVIIGNDWDDDGAESAGSAYIFERQGSQWAETAKLAAGDAFGGDYFGASVCIWGGTALVGAFANDDAGNGSGSAYVFGREGSQWRERAKLTAGDARPGAYFGGGVALWGGTAVIGASYDSDTAYRSGSVYVYPLCEVKFSATPGLIAAGESSTLSWSSGAAASLRIDPGVGAMPASGTLAVHPTDSTMYTITACNQLACGRAQAHVEVIDPSVSPTVELDAYPAVIEPGQWAVLRWVAANAQGCAIEPGIGQVDTSGGWVVRPAATTGYTVKASGPGGETAASATVAVRYPPVIRLLEPDGISDDAVEAFTVVWDDEDMDSDAAIHLYYDTDDGGYDGILLAEGIREDEDGEAADRYVWDTSGVPEGTYYVYAVIDDGACDPVAVYSSGAVTVDHSLLPQEKRLLAAAGSECAFFGNAIALDGACAAVGAPVAANGEVCPGAVYVFQRERNLWREEARLEALGGNDMDNFGHSVAVAADVLVVGAPYDDEQGPDAGAAYIFARKARRWHEQVKLTPPGDAAGDFFGYQVALNGERVIVGAPWDNDRGTKAGAAYIYRREGASWELEAKLTAGDGEPRDHFGWSVAICGEYALMGARFAEADGQRGAGVAYVFRREGSTWHEQAKLTAWDAAPWACFGSAVALEGSRCVVGAEWDHEKGAYAGAAYAFQRVGPIWKASAKLTAPDTAAEDSFGSALALCGDTVIVGAFGKDDDGAESGAAYIFFAREDSQWGEPVKLRANHAAPDDWFGYAVAVDDTCVLIGAISDDEGAFDSGSARVFPLAHVTIGAEPQITVRGNPVLLSWDSVHAGSVRIDPYPGAVRARGSRKVFPQRSTAYTISGRGVLGDDSDEVTVYVTDPNMSPSAKLLADPPRLMLGETATLTWNTRNADTCALAPDIGSVPPSGWLEVAPQETTTYMLKASGPAGEAAAETTVAVSYPAPEACLRARPATIARGGQASLEWTTANADACDMEPGIGPVAPSGSVTVTPTESTAYTLTAGGRGGQAVAEAIVSVGFPPPTAEITAEPGEILLGDAARLTWCTTGAYAYQIVPAIGSIGASGSQPVSPEETTAYTLSAYGQGGSAAATATVGVSSLITLAITSPAKGDPLESPEILVEGTVDNLSDSRETGVGVNGIPAAVSAGRFAANHVPLASGENTLTVLARDEAGHRGKTSMVVQYGGEAAQFVRLRAGSCEGVAPLETTLSLEASFPFTKPLLTVTGPGEAVFLENKEEDAYTVRCETPGIYTFEAELVYDGSSYRDRIALQVLDRDELDGILQARWQALRTSLLAQDVEGALQHFGFETQELYRGIYEAMGPEMSRQAAAMQDIEFVDAVDNVIRYRIRKDQIHGGKEITVTYYIYFMKDDSGMWKIYRY